jgi:hypothetical protein
MNQLYYSRACSSVSGTFPSKQNIDEKLEQLVSLEEMPQSKVPQKFNGARLLYRQFQ